MTNQILRGRKHLIALNPNDLPTKWLNMRAVLPEKLPPVLDPDDDKHGRVEIMRRIRPQAMIQQDETNDEWIDIPEEVLEKFVEIGRPTPLMRAVELERYLDTPAKIYIKREDLLPSHSFKLNTAVAQAYYAKKENAEGLITETGAGQWGVSLSYACNMFDLKTIVFWVKVSVNQKPLRRAFSEMLGATVYPSPSAMTKAGREILDKNPDHYGSLGTAIGEAISFSMEHDSYKYASGSNLSHVLLHQSIIGLETKMQLELAGEQPDILVGCCGGGSNLGGLIAPWVRTKSERPDTIRLFAAESEAAPRLSRGRYMYDHSDPVGLTPQVLSYTLGMDYMPPPVHVGGLRQHNGSPIIGMLKHKDLLESRPYTQEEIFEAGRLFIQLYRIIPAPETCHAIKATIDLALEAKRNNEKKTIVMCFSGNGLLDLSGYSESLNKSK